MDGSDIIINLSRSDKIRNKRLKQKINVAKSLSDDHKDEKIQWYERAQRMDEGRYQTKLRIDNLKDGKGG